MRIPVISSRLALAAGLACVIVLLTAGSPACAQNASDDLRQPRDATIPPPVKLVEQIGKDYPMGQTTDALAAPSLAASPLLRLHQGAPVKVVGLLVGNGWYQIELPDTRLAYVQTAAIPAASGMAPPPAAAAPATDAAPAAEPAADEGPTLDLPPTIDFVEADDQLSVITPTAVYLAPNTHAPKAYPLAVGRMVGVIAKSRDGNWAWVNTADGTPAYIPLADMAPPPASAQ